MNKIIGLLMAWGAERWIRPAIKQALEYCDEVMVVVASFGHQMKRFEDNTYEICKEYRDIRLLDYEVKQKYVSQAVAEVHNYMLEKSELFLAGNWIWILDVDEFYPEIGYKRIKSIIEGGKYDRIIMESKFFMINMQHYLTEMGHQLIRIEEINDRFIPTNNWPRKPKSIYTIPREIGMFHYSMLVNTNIHRVKWGMEYSHTSQSNKVMWLDKIYPKYDLENEDYWIKENLKLSGIKSPWLNGGYKPDENGRLFRYDGKHPKFIEDTGLTKIRDFRKKWQGE